MAELDYAVCKRDLLVETERLENLYGEFATLCELSVPPSRLLELKVSSLCWAKINMGHAADYLREAIDSLGAALYAIREDKDYGP